MIDEKVRNLAGVMLLMIVIVFYIGYLYDPTIARSLELTPSIGYTSADRVVYGFGIAAVCFIIAQFLVKRVKFFQTQNSFMRLLSKIGPIVLGILVLVIIGFVICQYISMAKF